MLDCFYGWALYRAPETGLPRVYDLSACRLRAVARPLAEPFPVAARKRMLLIVIGVGAGAIGLTYQPQLDHRPKSNATL